MDKEVLSRLPEYCLFDEECRRGESILKIGDPNLRVRYNTKLQSYCIYGPSKSRKSMVLVTECRLDDGLAALPPIPWDFFLEILFEMSEGPNSAERAKRANDKMIEDRRKVETDRYFDIFSYFRGLIGMETPREDIEKSIAGYKRQVGT